MYLEKGKEWEEEGDVGFEVKTGGEQPIKWKQTLSFEVHSVHCQGGAGTLTTLGQRWSHGIVLSRVA